MALFGKKEEEVVATDAVEEKTAAPKKEKAIKKVVTKATENIGGAEDISRVLTQPRITEKATLNTDKGVYVFDVAPDANKKQIKEAIKKVYNVDVKKINVSKIARKYKRNARTGIKGMKSGGKKAYVYLKKGDSISLM